jgi:hypothetical protein
MPVIEFLDHFRTASLLLHPVDDVGNDPPTDEQLEGARKYSRYWLTPLAVAGFDPDDFYTLSPEEKAALAEHVERFMAVAEKVPSGATPAPEQVREAREHFLAVRRMVDRYVWDRESWDIICAIEKARQDWFRKDPGLGFIVGADVRVGEDATGDPAVSVWFIVTDAAAADDRIFEFLPLLREYMTELLDAMGHRRFVYLFFQSLSGVLERLAGVPE